MNKIVLLTSAAVMCFTTISKSIAETWDCGDQGNNVQCTLDEDGTFTVSGSGKMADYEYDTYDGVGNGPSSGAPWGGSRAAMNRIKSIIVKDGVTKIGKGSFTGAAALVSVSMSGVEVVGEQAFRDAYLLKEAYMPKVEIIETGGFDWNKSLENVYAPSVRIIDSLAFENAVSLKYIEMGNNVSIGSSAFHNTKIQNCGNGGTCINCGDKYALLGKGCVNKCPDNFKINDGYCDRIRYTPAEAAQVLRDDNTNEVTITFKK